MPGDGPAEDAAQGRHQTRPRRSQPARGSEQALRLRLRPPHLPQGCLYLPQQALRRLQSGSRFASVVGYKWRCWPCGQLYNVLWKWYQALSSRLPFSLILSTSFLPLPDCYPQAATNKQIPDDWLRGADVMFNLGSGYSTLNCDSIYSENSCPGAPGRCDAFKDSSCKSLFKSFPKHEKKPHGTDT